MRQVADAPLGDGWFWTLRLEMLGRNFATAGALETAYRLGHAGREIAELEFEVAPTNKARRPSVVTG